MEPGSSDIDFQFAEGYIIKKRQNIEGSTMKKTRGVMASLMHMGVLFCMLGFHLDAEDRGIQVVARSVVGRQDFDVGRQYAVLIGIDRYREWTALKGAVKEARQVREVLERRYYIDEFLELYDEEATAANIRKLLADDLPRRVGKNDSVLLFYAGHGFLDSSQTGFWIAVDGTRDQYDQRGWIANSQLRNLLSQIKAQRILVMADACFSGDFLDSSRGAVPTVDEAYFRKALQLTARQVLTSGSSETVPDRSEFGTQLLNLLERNNDPLLDPYTIYDRIRRGITVTQPLLGTIPGNEPGASFVLFLKAQYGTIRVSSLSDARVLLDGKEAAAVQAGREAVLERVPSGPHSLGLVYADRSEEQVVVLAPDQDLAVAFRYKPAVPGSIVVRAEGAASVLVDGTAAGRMAAGSSLTLAGLAAGDHLITLQYRDKAEERRVAVLEGTASVVSFSYVPEALGDAAFLGFPDGSRVSAGGRDAGVVKDGKLEVRGLRAGVRSFQVSHDSWQDSMTVRAEIREDATAEVVFAGATMLLDSVPEGVQVSVDGIQAVKPGGPRQNVSIGPYPEGHHSVAAGGGTYGTWRADIQVPGTGEVPVSLRLTAREGPAPAAASQAAPGALKAGFVNVVQDAGQDGNLVVRIRRLADGAPPEAMGLAGLSEESRFADQPIEMKGTQVAVKPGRWIAVARRTDDSKEACIQPFTVEGGSLVEVRLPLVGYSLAHQITEAAAVQDKAGRDYREAVGRQKLFKDIGTGSLVGCGISAAMAVGAFVWGSIAYQEYAAITTVQGMAASSSRSIVTGCSVATVIGAIDALLMGAGSLIGLIEVPEIPRLEREYTEARSRLEDLRSRETGSGGSS